MPQNLPKDLGSQDPITLAKIKALWANMPMNMGIPQLDGLSLQKGAINYQPDNTLRLMLNKDGAGTNMSLGHLQLGGLLGYDGHFNASAQYPVLGGLLSGNITHGPSGNSYGLQYQRNF